MRRLTCILLVTAAAGLAGCGDAAETEVAAPTSTATAAQRLDAGDCKRFDRAQLVGLKEAAADSRAQAHGCTVRVIERDGEVLAATKDLRMNRLNVIIDGGVVQAVAYVG